MVACKQSQPARPLPRHPSPLSSSSSLLFSLSFPSVQPALRPPSQANHHHTRGRAGGREVREVGAQGFSSLFSSLSLSPSPSLPRPRESHSSSSSLSIHSLVIFFHCPFLHLPPRAQPGLCLFPTPFACRAHTLVTSLSLLSIVPRTCPPLLLAPLPHPLVHHLQHHCFPTQTPRVHLPR